jgi:DNA helicase II / ATP-dependent DNA helicase PcrA
MTITPELKPDLISPKLFTEFQQLNEEQRRIVLHDQGPMMVIAGPGSGKTRCLTLRAMNLLLLKKASPQEMVLCTYTEKAAFEMQDRLSTIARRVGYSEDIAQIRIGTIHGICNRIIMENLHRIPATDQQTPPLGNNYEMIVGPYNLSSARAGKSLGFTKTNKLLYDFLGQLVRCIW